MPDLPSLVPDAPVVSKRLSLRPMTVDDVAAVAAIRARPEVYAHLSHGALSEEQLDARLRLRVARMTMTSDKESSVHFVVELHGTAGEAGEASAPSGIVGDCGTKVVPVWTKDDEPTEHLVATINYALVPEVAGHGLGAELVGLLTAHAFAEPRVHRIRADVFAANEASRKVLHRNGFREEGYFVDDGIIDGEFVDACQYALLRREWHEPQN